MSNWRVQKGVGEKAKLAQCSETLKDLKHKTLKMLQLKLYSMLKILLKAINWQIT